MTANEISTVAGALTLAVWAYLLLGRGKFWRLQKYMATEDAMAARPSQLPAVGIVVPARNEAAMIGRSLESLLAQSYGGAIHVFVVDDGSTDGTAEVAIKAAMQAARQTGTRRTGTVIAGKPLPPGWTGKLWAVQQGVERAGEIHPEFLLLTDADVVHGPETLAVLVSLAEAGGYDLVSFMVKLECQSLAERLLIPAFVFFFFKLYPPAWISDPGKSTAGAAGGCMLIRREALAKAGGIAAIRAEIIDDCALARAVKQSGGKLWLGLAPESQSIRSYRSFSEIARMISRTAFNQLGHSTALLVLATLAMTVTYLLPVGLLFADHAVSAICGGITWAAMMICYLPAVRAYKLNPLWGLTLPVAAIFYMVATLDSALSFWRGRGGEWKGRIQDPGR